MMNFKGNFKSNPLPMASNAFVPNLFPTLQPGVLYKPLQGDSQDVTWMRPMSEFQDHVETAQGKVQRFALVPEGL